MLFRSIPYCLNILIHSIVLTCFKKSYRNNHVNLIRTIFYGFLSRLIILVNCGGRLAELSATVRSICLLPVSYTHLDVYKRQMVARGDMGVEIDFTEIPIIQKDIIWRGYNAGKPFITATQMLDSMIEHPLPTRAEITDVANAIYDGTSAIIDVYKRQSKVCPVHARRLNPVMLRTAESAFYQKHNARREPEFIL